MRAKMVFLICVALLVASGLSWSWGSAAVFSAVVLAIACLKRWSIRLPPFLPEVAMFVGVVVISSFLGRDFRLSYNSMSLVISYLILWVLIAAFSENLYQRLFFASVGVLFGYHAFQAVTEIVPWYLSWMDVTNSGYPFQSSLLRLSKVRNWPNEYAVFLVVCIPLLAYASSGCRNLGRWKMASLLDGVSVLGLLLVLYTRSRVGLLGIGLEAGLGIILFAPTRATLLRWGGILGVCLGVSLGDDALAGTFSDMNVLDSWRLTHSLTPFLAISILVLAAVSVFPRFSIPQGKLMRRFSPYGLSSLCLGIPLILGIWRSAPVAAAFNPLESLDSGRAQLWGVALGNFLESPWLGQGPGAFGLAWAGFHETSNSWVAMHAHNASLEILSSFGVAGLAATFFLLSSLFKLVLPLTHKESRVLLCIIIGLAGSFTFDSPFTSPSNVGLILLTVAWGLDFGRRTPERRLQMGPLLFPLLLVPFLMLYWAIGLRPELVDFERSRVSREKMALDSAASQSLRAVVQGPGNALLWRERALVLVRLGDLPGASGALDSVLKFEPSHGAAWLNQAWIRLQMRDTSGAIDVLHRSGARTDLAFHGIPGAWLEILSGGNGSARFDSVVKVFGLFPFTSLCHSSRACVEWRGRYLARDPGWVALQAGADSNKSYGTILDYLAHTRAGRSRTAAWMRKAVHNEPLYDYSLAAMDGDVQIGRLFKPSHNGIYLQGYDAQERILFDGVEQLFAVTLR